MEGLHGRFPGPRGVPHRHRLPGRRRRRQGARLLRRGLRGGGTVPAAHDPGRQGADRPCRDAHRRHDPHALGRVAGDGLPRAEQARRVFHRLRHLRTRRRRALRTRDQRRRDRHPARRRPVLGRSHGHGARSRWGRRSAPRTGVAVQRVSVVGAAQGDPVPGQGWGDLPATTVVRNGCGGNISLWNTQSRRPSGAVRHRPWHSKSLFHRETLRR